MTRAIGRRACAAIVAAAMLAPAHAATLDAAPVGDDVVFTWDTPGPDTILRGTQPDALVPWLVNVTSPVTAPSENLLRGENAFYELASGSNRAWRVELDLPAPNTGQTELGACLSLPERRAYTALDLFALWPDLISLKWWDGATQKSMAIGRFGNALIGDDAAALPRHGGVRAAFARATTITIVGSRDDAYPGVDATDFVTGQTFALAGFPPDALLPTSFQVLCGQRDVDWFDADGNGHPDDCGPDLDADGDADTGIWRAPVPPQPGSLSAAQVTTWDAGGQIRLTVTGTIVLGNYRFTGFDRPIAPGTAVTLLGVTTADLNLPFRPPVR